MNGTIVTVYQNGAEAARSELVRDRWNVHENVPEENIKQTIWQQLCMVGRVGHVLVHWNDKWWICEMKSDLKGYTRIQIDYHPVISRVMSRIRWEISAWGYYLSNMNQYITDRTGKIVGRLNDGYVYDRGGTQQGRYNEKENRTYDRTGKFIGKGDLRVGLIKEK